MLYTNYNGMIVCDNTLVAYDGESKKVIIPHEVGNQTIERIGAGAFLQSNVTSVELEEGIKEIAESAFGWCMNLKKMIIPASVNSVKNKAFFHHTFNQNFQVYRDFEEDAFHEILSASQQVDDNTYLYCDYEGGLLTRVIWDYFGENVNFPKSFPQGISHLIYSEDWRTHKVFTMEGNEKIEDHHMVTGYAITKRELSQEPDNDICFSDMKNNSPSSVTLLTFSVNENKDTTYRLKINFMYGVCYYPTVIPVQFSGSTYYLEILHYLDAGKKELCDIGSLYDSEGRYDVADRDYQLAKKKMFDMLL